MRVLAEDANLLAADAGDALEEGLLPGLQLDELHTVQRLGHDLETLVLPLHQLLLDRGQVGGLLANGRNGEKHESGAEEGGHADLQ